MLMDDLHKISTGRKSLTEGIGTGHITSGAIYGLTSQIYHHDVNDLRNTTPTSSLNSDMVGLGITFALSTVTSACGVSSVDVLWILSVVPIAPDFGLPLVKVMVVVQPFASF